jgi:hypothetical protein
LHRHVHFSLHFENDFARLAKILEHVDPANLSAAPYESEDAWAKIAANPGLVQSWIDKRLHSVDAVIVLIGTQTYSRPIVRAEIAAAALRRRPFFGIYVNKIPREKAGADLQKGENPFKYVTFSGSGSASNARCYDWSPGEPLPIDKWIR